MIKKILIFVSLLISLSLVLLSNPGSANAQFTSCTGYTLGTPGFCASDCLSHNAGTDDNPINPECISPQHCCVVRPYPECAGVTTGSSGYCMSGNRLCPSPYTTENPNDPNDCIGNPQLCCIGNPIIPTPTTPPATSCQPGQNCCVCSINGQTRMCIDVPIDNCDSPNYVPVCTTNTNYCTTVSGPNRGCNCTLDSNLNCGHWGENCCNNMPIRCFGYLICNIGNICTQAGTSPAPPGPCPANNLCLTYSTPDLCNSAHGSSVSCSRTDGTVGNCCVAAASVPTTQNVQRNPLNPLQGCGLSAVNTAIGCIPIGNSNSFITFVLGWALGISGGIALILIIVSAFLIMTSQGDPRRLQAGKELLTAAITGLLLLIFSVFILDLLGVRILRLPGF